MFYIAYLVHHHLQADPELHPLLLPADSPETRLRNDIRWAEVLAEYVRGRLRNNTVKMMARVTDNVTVTEALQTGGRLPKLPELDPPYYYDYLISVKFK